MSRPLLLALFTATALTLSAGACDGGGDDDDDDIVDIDATPAVADAAADVDAGPTACETLCSCTFSVCGQDETECMTACEGLSPTALSCRTQHCGFAQSDATTHCPHARGESLCD